jgi:hypothetical protein
MPSPWHDGVTQLFRDDPHLAVMLLRECAGLDLPSDLPARLESPSFNDRPSSDFQADMAVVEGPSQDPVHGTIVEAQQARIESKRQQLPRYAAALWLLIRRPVDILVVCPDQATADWYARPIPTTLPGYTSHPRAIGPGQIPAIHDPRQVAARPGLGALSMAMHGGNRAVAEAFMAGLALLTPEAGPTYYENAYSMSSTAIRQILEELVSTTAWPVYSPFAKEHFGRGRAEGIAEGKAEGIAEGKAEGIAEGKAEGETEAILLVLQARGLEVSAEEHARVVSCTDLDQLKTWVRRAATVHRTSELFG